MALRGFKRARIVYNARTLRPHEPWFALPLCERALESGLLGLATAGGKGPEARPNTDPRRLKHRPSMIAASATFLALEIQGRVQAWAAATPGGRSWDATMLAHTTCSAGRS